MKVSTNSINQFRKVCLNEDKTPTKEIIYKIRRDVELGRIITITGEESYIVAFGQLRLLCEKGLVVSVWKDATKSYKSSRYRKYIYDYLNRGSDYANSKCYR